MLQFLTFDELQQVGVLAPGFGFAPAATSLLQIIVVIVVVREQCPRRILPRVIRGPRVVRHV